MVMAAPIAAQAESAVYQPTNDWGDTGLLQNPTAYFQGAGEMRFTYSRPLPYDVWGISVQPFDWFEATYRWVAYTNQPFVEGGDDDYLDKNLAIKARLWEERPLIPQVSVGIIDIGGTGLLSSEFVVASKRISDFEATLGVGWGRLGARGDFKNPFTYFADSFATRDVGVDSAAAGQAGDVSLSSLFHGEKVGIFGGLRWAPQDAPYSLILELEGNDYEHEPFGNNLRQRSPVNVGANYRLGAFDFGLAYERGDQLTFRITLGGNFEDITPSPKTLDPPPSPLAPAADAIVQPPEERSIADQEARFVAQLREALARQGFTLYAVDFTPEQGLATIWFKQDSFRHEAVAFTRAARTASALAPPIYQQFTLVSLSGPTELYRVTVDRAAVREVAAGTEPDDVMADTSLFSPPQASRPLADYDHLASYPQTSWSLQPKTRQSIGDPYQFVYAQLWLALSGRAQLTERLDVSGMLGLNIWNNFDENTRQSDSTLPHVRSDVATYLKEGDTGIPSLYGNYIWPISSEWYGRLSAGYFEFMYGGVAGEVLYRPFGKDWAVSWDLNRVRQRGYDQRFDFLDYEATTGHMTLYYQIEPLSMLAKVSAGQYLAGDRGVTVDLSRTFRSGAAVGVFATKTNVSSEEFGEGSFDKGFYISLPLDLFYPRSTKRQAVLALRPLTRDGGQKVFDGRELYYLTSGSDLDAIADAWHEVGY